MGIGDTVISHIFELATFLTHVTMRKSFILLIYKNVASREASASISIVAAIDKALT
jgi:hypothetical protein